MPRIWNEFYSLGTTEHKCFCYILFLLSNDIGLDLQIVLVVYWYYIPTWLIWWIESENHRMMMSLHGNAFRITGVLWRDFTGHLWIHLTKDQLCGPLMFEMSWPWCYNTSIVTLNTCVSIISAILVTRLGKKLKLCEMFANFQSLCISKLFMMYHKCSEI